MKFRINGRQPIPVLDDASDGVGIEEAEKWTGWNVKALAAIYEAVFGDPEDVAATEAIEKVLSSWRSDPAKVIIRNSEFKDVGDEDLAIFLVLCEQRGLDPWRGQAYPLFKYDKRKGNRIALGVPIETQRAIADETKIYAGNDEPIHEYTADGKTLIRTVMHVYKFVCDQRVRFSGDAHYADYFPDNTDPVASQHSRACLAIAAEAQGLRRAFPRPLSKMYAPEEFSGNRRIGGPGAGTPASGVATTLADEDTPHTYMGLHMALMQLELDKPAERDAAIAEVKAMHPGLIENDERAFYAKVILAARANPTKWRAAAI